MSNATTQPDIRSASRAVVLGLGGVPTEGEWEGITYTPKLGTPWLRDGIEPVYSDPVSNGMIENLVLYTLTFFYPVDATKGTRDIDAAVGKVLDAFKVGTWLEYGNTRAISLKAERRRMIVEPAWLSVPIIARLQAYSLD